MANSHILDKVDSLPDPLLPIPLLPEIDNPQPYPVEALPKRLQQATLAIAEHVQAPIPLAAMVVIGAATTLAQSRINAPDCAGSPTGQPCSLFLLTQAESGDRKSSCRRLAFWAIDEHERALRTAYQQEVSRIASEAKALSALERRKFQDDFPPPCNPQTQFSDATFEPLAGAFIRGLSAATLDTDEGGQFFGGTSMKADHRAAVVGGLVKLFDTGSVDRTRSANNAEGSGAAYNRRLSVLLLAQPVAISDALRDPLLLGQGLLPRFLFTDTETLAGTRFIGADQPSPYDDPRLHQFWDRCRELIKLAPQVDPASCEVIASILPLAPDAERVKIDRYNAIEREQNVLGRFRSIRPFASRATELALRVATVLAFFEGKDQVDATLLRNAFTLIEYSLDEWLKYQGHSKQAPALLDAAKLFEWLVTPKRKARWRTFHKNQLSNQGTKRSNAAARDRLLKILVEHRYLLTEDNLNYRVNPLACAESAESAERQEQPGQEAAEPTRNHADNNPAGSASAPFRKDIATEVSVNTGPCASSADSAPIYKIENGGATF